ncbi:arylsulfatase H [Nannospalax galili]|uniref:arylsulfatase H n=1 Tax=Nannospalax galili TaxID=1026970 RepID=UPI0004ED0634|nr:arylsulfatase H [Nannospalax galili]
MSGARGHWSPRLWLALCCLCGNAPGTFVTRNSRPNIVLFMADDLGVGDLSCYGNNTISTPNIDRLAREGVVLTQHLAAASVCTPSRAAFLTGRYPVRSGMASPNNLNRGVVWLGGSGGLPPNETTFAKILQQRGYRTGLVGKWHLGLSCASRGDHCSHPLNHGFDAFYGAPSGLLSDCRGWATPELHRALRVRLWLVSAGLGCLPLLLLVPKLAGWCPVPWAVVALLGVVAAAFFLCWFCSYGFVRTWNCVIMRNHDVVQQPMNTERAAALMLREALAFVDRYKRGPFLLFVSFLHVHTPLPTRGTFVGRSKHGLYGDNVEEMDWMVGKVLDALERELLTNQTLVYFTSDNGARLEARQGDVRLGGWNGVYKGGRGTGGWEGGIRVPGIFRWPTVLEAGRLIDEPTSHMDIFPTLSYVGGGILPQDSGSTVWKAHYVTPNFSPEGADACYGPELCPCSGDVTRHDPPLLFDVSRDPSESRPLDPSGEALFDSVVKNMEAAVRRHRAGLRPVPQQLSTFNSLWKPWLQPCCGTFPFCGCDAEDDFPPTAP